MIGDDLELDPGIGTCGKDGQGVPVGVGQHIKGRSTHRRRHGGVRFPAWRSAGQGGLAQSGRNLAVVAGVQAANGALRGIDPGFFHFLFM